MERTNEHILTDPTLATSELEALAATRLASLLADAPKVAAGILTGEVEERGDAEIVIKNVARVMDIALRNHDDSLFSQGVGSLVEMWTEGDFKALLPIRPPEFEASLWENLAINLYALGGLAVSGGQWPQVRELTLPAPTGGASDKSWLRQGQVASSRANDHYPDESILRLASRRVRDLRPTVSESEALQLLARFDLLSGLIISESNERGFFPNAAELGEALVEGLVIDELRFPDSPVRKSVFPGETEMMVEALKEYDRKARLQASLARYGSQDWAWRGFSDARTLIFLAEEHLLEDWQAAAHPRR
jgi:hypothetical protein